MKKKLLLIALPALMAISGCSNLYVKQAEKVEENLANSLVEDNLAHEEVFGEAGTPKQIGVKKLGSPEDIDDVKMGVQMQYDSIDNEVSIRFVAAIKYTNVTAFWERGLAVGDGSEGIDDPNSVDPEDRLFTFGDGSIHESTKYYTSLNNDGDIITAGSGEYSGYVGFLVYTLIYIPYDEFEDSFLAAKLYIEDKDDSSNFNATNVYAAKLKYKLVDHDDDDSTPKVPVPEYVFNFADDDMLRYFLYGRIGGANNTLKNHDDEAVMWEPENNNASYQNVELSAGDYFGSFFFAAGSFKYFSYSSRFTHIFTQIDKSATVDGFAAPYAAGRYNFYVSKGLGEGASEYDMYISIARYDGKYQMYMKPSSEWSSAGARFAVYGFVDNSDNAWYDLTDPDGDGIFTVPDSQTYAQKYTKFIMCRMNPATSTNNWDNVWSQTDNRDFYGPGSVCEMSGYSVGNQSRALWQVKAS